MTTVHIPSLVRDLTGNAGEVAVEIPAGEKMAVREVLLRLEERFPGITARLTDEAGGGLMPGLAVVINGEQAGMGMLAKVSQQDDVFFVAAIVGG